MFSSPSCALLAQMGFLFEGTWWSSCHPFSVVPAEAIEEKTHYLVLRAKLAWYPLLLYITSDTSLNIVLNGSLLYIIVVHMHWAVQRADTAFQMNRGNNPATVIGSVPV